MAEGSDTKRRLIMMLTIILAGSAVTFLDLSPLIVIFIAVGIGLVMLFALNMITLDELKEDIYSLKDKLNQPVTLKKDKSKEVPEKDERKEAKTKEKPKTDKEKKELPFASIIQKLPFFNKESAEKPKKEAKKSQKSLLSGIPAISGLLSRKKDVETKSKKIDELLDKTLSDEFTPDTDIPVADEDSVVSNEEDEFSDFDNFDLGLEEEETTSIPKSTEISGFEEEISESTIADILAKEGIELELTDEEFPKASAEEDKEDSGDISGRSIGDIDELDDDVSGFDLDSDELGDFDEIDLDELEPEDEIDLGEEDIIEDVEIGDSGEELSEPQVATVEEEDILSAPPKEWTQTKTSGLTGADESMFESPMSLSLGGGESDEDDLFAMLKSDTKKAVSVQELSLVRDLKDAKIDSEELVEDLEEILFQFGIEKEQIQDKNKIIDEGDINN